MRAPFFVTLKKTKFLPMSDVQERLDLLTSFCGYGNPETAKVFFIGIEEHDTLNCHGDAFLEFEKKIKRGRASDGSQWAYAASFGKAIGSTERTQCEVYKSLFGNATDEHIFQNEIHCFNFYPLGANSLKQYPSHYNNCFGFETKSDLYEYFDNRSRRKQVLKSFIDELIIKKEKLLFVFGRRCCDEVEKHLLPELHFEKTFHDWCTKTKRKPSEIKWSDNKLVWLTGHPSYGWINSEVIQKIACIIKVT